MLTEKQREERRSQLGASEVYKIMNFDNLTAKNLWKEKIGLIEVEEFENDSMMAGNLLEEDCLKYFFKYCEITDYTLNERIEHNEIKGLVASLDGYDCGVYAPIECKTVGYTQHEKWNKSKYKIPKNYYLQVQTQISCCSSSNGILVAFLLTENDKIDPINYYLDESKMFIYPIERDEEIIEEIESRSTYFLGCIRSKREPKEADYLERHVF